MDPISDEETRRAIERAEQKGRRTGSGSTRQVTMTSEQKRDREAMFRMKEKSSPANHKFGPFYVAY
jgi:hypothetical protein